jgi:rod shape-determining protein MreD
MNQALNQRDMFFKWLYYAGATLLLVLVQSLVLNRICVWGVHPFLPPLIAAITAMLEGPGEGAAFAGVFGLLCDLTMPGIIPCFYTLAFLAAALLAAVIAKRFLSQGFLCAVLCAALALVITDLLHTVLLTFRQGVELSAALSLTGREAAVTVVLSPLVYLLLRSVHNRILK